MEFRDWVDAHRVVILCPMEGEQRSDRGWVALGTAGRLVGHVYIHGGDDSGFLCEPWRVLQRHAK